MDCCCCWRNWAYELAESAGLAKAAAAETVCCVDIWDEAAAAKRFAENCFKRK